MRVNHGGFYVTVAKKLLDCPDVVAIFQQMSGKRVPERMAGRSFHQACLDHGFMNGTLYTAFVHVESALLASCGVSPSSVLWENPLPAPIGGSGHKLAVKGPGKGDAAEAVGDIGLMKGLDGRKMRDERGFERFGQHRHAVFRALSVSNEDFVEAEIDVLHAKTETLGETESGPVHDSRGEEFFVLKMEQDEADFLAAQDDGEMDRLLRANDVSKGSDVALEHVSIEKEDGGKRLVLCRGAHLDINGKRGQKRINMPLVQRLGTNVSMISEKTLKPRNIRIAGAGAIVLGLKKLDTFCPIRRDRFTRRSACV